MGANSVKTKSLNLILFALTILWSAHAAASDCRETLGLDQKTLSLNAVEDDAGYRSSTGKKVVVMGIDGVLADHRHVITIQTEGEQNATAYDIDGVVRHVRGIVSFRAVGNGRTFYIRRTGFGPDERVTVEELGRGTGEFYGDSKPVDAKTFVFTERQSNGEKHAASRDELVRVSINPAGSSLTF